MDTDIGQGCPRLLLILTNLILYSEFRYNVCFVRVLLMVVVLMSFNNFVRKVRVGTHTQT